MEICDAPLAVPGLQSYRYRGRFGWVMIGAKSDEEALREVSRGNLEVWRGKYVPV